MNPYAIPGLKERRADTLPQEKFIAEAIQLAGEMFGLTERDWNRRRSRKKNFVSARRFAMAALRYRNLAYKEVGSYFVRGQDHTTVIHSLWTLSDILTTDEGERNLFAEYLSQLHIPPAYMQAIQDAPGKAHVLVRRRTVPAVVHSP